MEQGITVRETGVGWCCKSYVCKGDGLREKTVPVAIGPGL